MGTCINRRRTYDCSACQEADQYCKCPNHKYWVPVLVLILLSPFEQFLEDMEGLY